jgi:hypothetical protein
MSCITAFKKVGKEGKRKKSERQIWLKIILQHDKASDFAKETTDTTSTEANKHTAHK